ncbi:MAG: hypothetical protein LUI12_01845 [Clostridiales bacterium]|nr:hypothetical protein [Clostridiales bacterium]
MAKKKYNVDILSAKSIERLKNDLLNYQKSLQDKTDEFVKRLAEVGIPVVNAKMAEANFTVDEKGIVSGSDTNHNAYVRLQSFGTYSQATLIVEGAELLFIEFGSGVHYNGAAGTSPNPKGQEFGYTIGSYGKGHGKQDTWGYIDDSGALVLTHGTKATMPVYSASLEIIDKYKKVAKEVFK